MDDDQWVLQVRVNDDDGVPRAASNPAVTAAWCPKFRANPSTLTRRSSAAHAINCSSVSSVLPSLTSNTSASHPSVGRKADISFRNSPITGPSL